MKSVSGKALCKIVEKYGWVLKRVTDSHHIYAKEQKHHIRKLFLFGSILREDFNPDRSDVDFLVEFLPNATSGFFGLAGMENELSDMIGRKADLRTAQELSKYFRQEVIDEAIAQDEQVLETAL